MNKYVATDNLVEVLNKRILPTITLWNRLEGRPRTDNLERALRAEVRDPLWMLTRQWQMGEFIGDDAGTPVFSKIHMGSTHLTKYLAGEGPVQPFTDAVPLEAQVEQQPIPFISGKQELSLDIRLLIGRQWLKMVAAVGDYRSDYIGNYPITTPDKDSKDDVQRTAHREVWQQFSAVAGRSMDGAKLLLHLQNPANHAWDNIPALAGDLPKQAAVDAVAEKFKAWYKHLFFQPADPATSAWKPRNLEYQFACSAPVEGTEKVLTADEYYHGHLDWYNLDIDPKQATLGDTPPPPPDTELPVTNTFMPVPVQFDGMPNTRWWAFEDGRTNLGKLNPGPTDLGKLLYIEFALVYANDWFLLPFTLDAGSIARIKGMTVTNVFGERTWIEAAGRGLDDAWNKWSMFTLSTKGKGPEKTDNSLLILPVVPKMLEGAPLEEVHLLRDEVANMVWAVETTVPLATGWGKSGAEAAVELRRKYQQLLDASGPLPPAAPLIPNEAAIRYEVMNTVPENWIPFIPAQQDATKRAVHLQRAAMPRILENDTSGKPEKIKPRTPLLREGLDKGLGYFINEEEVPRAGTNVYRAYQRTRWYNGAIFTWVGTRKQTGRGEGASNLAFDRILKK
ncbi:hypothetical protein [Chitinophaga sp. sic0106]|uniref:hypothetical protein n=1 Tax=Chitinophaga sp. sic0106 TaxID=2854785 RepID=UPI001C487AA7|nr:hypothetical protein [Chitinophaga sp. sic0106]MBV7530640.1 hypothetical protein [Chitinophaga sp. sic0106]